MEDQQRKMLKKAMVERDEHLVLQILQVGFSIVLMNSNPAHE
jgi:hypothetical protein